MQAGDISEEISKLIDQSRALEAVGEVGGAFQHANQAVQLARSVADGFADQAAALLGLAFIHFRLGHDAEVITLARQALELAPPDSRWKVDALMMLGAAGEGEDYMLQRKQRYLQVIDLARQIGYHRALVRGLHNLAAGVYMPWGQFELALSADREAAKLAQTYQMDDLTWGPLHTMGWILWLTHHPDEARAVVDQLADCSQPDSMGDAYVSLIRANLLTDDENFQEARCAYERSRGIGEKNGSPEVGIFVRLGLSKVERSLGNGAAARAWAEDALELTRRVQYPHQEGNALIACGRAAWCAGDLAAAETYLQEAIALLKPLRAAFEVTRASLCLAALWHEVAHPQAMTVWIKSVSLILENGYDFLLQQERSLILPLIASGLDAPDADIRKMSRDLAERLQCAPAEALRVQMLGQFSVQIGVLQVTKESLRQRRAGEVLALLLTSPGYGLTYQQVTEAICPEKDPDAALHFYHHAISALRHLLEPDLSDRRFACRYLDVDEERVNLRLPPASSVDFVEFESACKAKDWQKAISQYGGEFLPNLPYAEWTLPIRQHLADEYESALLALAEERWQNAESAECLSLCRKALLHNPWQERAALMGMRAAVALDDRIAALQLYQRLEKVLLKELGIAPQKELQQLYATLKKGTPKA